MLSADFQWVWWAAAFSPVPIIVGCALAVFAFWWQHRTVTRTIQSAIDFLPQFTPTHSLNPASPHTRTTRAQPDECHAGTGDVECARHAKKRRKSDLANAIGYCEDEKMVDAGPEYVEPLVSRISSDDPIVDTTCPRTYQPSPIGRRAPPAKPNQTLTAPSSSFSLFMSNEF
ncbi:hypothetical protein J3B01_001172 [Coemansia erecta]|nr:hypothetical protein IWW49_003355 [Coemansia sp. RSA 1797]KAJ2838777.1 hypothetical protein J3B01_001172 [Coemansia erecta]